MTPRELLQQTVELYRKEFWLFFGYAAWLLVPVSAYYFASALPDNPVTTTLIIVSVVLQLFIWLWISLCLMRATSIIASGKPADQGKISVESVRRVQPVLAVLFLQTLIVMGGFLLLVIPSIIFWTWYALAQVAAGLDDKKPIEALSYSRSLVTGRFFFVLWRIISGPLIIGILYALLSGFILFTLAPLFGTEISTILSSAPPLWAQLIQSIVDIFFIPLFIIYTVLLYQNLKIHPLEKVSPVA